MTKEEIFRHFEKHEGVISHMYLDTVGKVTVGIGFMIPDPHSALTYRLTNRTSGAPATSQEKLAEWTQVAQQTKGKIAQSYKKFTQLEMPDDEVRRVLDDKLRGFAESLRTRFAAFDTYPASAQLALLDMIFNLGPNGLFKGFPTMCKAVDRLDWAKCAAECNRKDISKDRNDETRDLFLAAIPAPASRRLTMRRIR
jgi:GH24 family phage-related lysozyme (muramidase)